LSHFKKTGHIVVKNTKRTPEEESKSWYEIYPWQDRQFICMFGNDDTVALRMGSYM